MGNELSSRYDCVVIGGGIAGMETALLLGDMGFECLLVEKEASIGGKMILLSKVFPTLDCASCIATPKMAAVQNHPRVTLLTYATVESIVPREDGRLEVEITRRPTFVDPSRCTGCGQCEKVCTVARPDQFNQGLVARRAIYIPFPQAVPKKAVIERRGLSPCSASCPAGLKPHGYVALIRNGRLERALHSILREAPLPGVLGRVCYAPCETRCTRGKKGQSIPLRALKRFVAENLPRQERFLPVKRVSKKVAVVGSGPSGLSCAYFLARKGLEVVIFERDEAPGGLLRYGIPTWRLPREILDRDLEDIKALGVKIVTGKEIRSLRALKEEGFEAIYLATGSLKPRVLGIPGEDLPGVYAALSFLRSYNTGKPPELSGKKVAVIGGGNVALDCARTALRCGADEVTVIYRRDREHMPAHSFEVEEALAEGVKFLFRRAPLEFRGKERLEEVLLAEVRLGEKDETGRARPMVDPSRTETFRADAVILAIGFQPEAIFQDEGFSYHPDGRLKVDPETLATNIEGVFAGGDCVTGPYMVANAVGAGKRAAYHIYRYLTGEEPRDIDLTPEVGRGDKAARVKLKAPVAYSSIFGENPLPEQAIEAAGRCLDCAVCSSCKECVETCPAGAIDLSMKPQKIRLEAGAVLIATGFRLFDPSSRPLTGYAHYPNVITAMQMERLLAPTRPYNAVLRPGDGKVPGNIGIVLCAGSRDEAAGNPWCSRICCMYSLKQAQLILGAIPIAEVTIYYIDLRAFGKGYEEFLQQAAGMGVHLVKGRVARIDELENGDLVVYYEDMEGRGGVRKARHELVILAVGALANPELRKCVREDLQLDETGFFREIDPVREPCATSVPGLFVAGAASGPKDIPDCVLHAGAAAAQIAAYLRSLGSEGA